MTITPQEIGVRFDRALAKGLRDAWDLSPSSTSKGEELHRTEYDVTECMRELLEIKSGSDFCYDRPGSAFAYAAWYHGERVNQFVGVLNCCPELDVRDRPWRVIDLGAGTGAVAWAIAARELSSDLSQKRPPICLQLVESSRPMLRLAWRLWQELESEFSNEGLKDRVTIQSWRHESWPQLLPATESTDLLTAHYLFDHSETGEQSKLNESVQLFRKQLRYQRVARLLCCITDQKKQVLNQLGSEMKDHGWSVSVSTPASGPLKGELECVGKFRLERTHQMADSSFFKAASRTPTYEGTARTGASVLFASSSSLFQDLGGIEDVLTREQERALDDRRPNVSIKGSAGSGKSLVLALRLARFVKSVASSTSGESVLFLSFNKSLVEKVACDTRDHCASREIQLEPKSESYSILTVGGRPRIHFGTLDSIVSQIFSHRKYQDEPSPSNLIVQARKICQEVNNGSWINALPISVAPLAMNGEPGVCGRSLSRTARFIADEYKTIYFGRAACITKDYIDTKLVTRSGRGAGLTSQQRNNCAALLCQFDHMFFRRRCEALTANPKSQFSAVVIDEAQDFTTVDFRLAARLLRNGGSWTIAFDASQAIRTGVTFSPPRMNHGWSQNRLTGSYRMPLRVCEALIPVVSHIRRQQEQLGIEDDLLSAPPVAARMSVLGSRPIVIATRGPKEFAVQVHRLLHTFDPPSDQKPGHQIVVLERDEELKKSLNAELAEPLNGKLQAHSKVTSLSSSVLAEKGMEFPWIVWSTRAQPSEPIDIHRLCYTIVSRCTRHIIIWLQLNDDGGPDQTLAPIFAGVGSLRRDRLLVIDQATENALNAFRSSGLE